MATNFDRATIFNMENPAIQAAYMTETKFHAFVNERLQDPGDDAQDIIRRCYRDISPFDISRPEAYEEARASALEQIRTRRLRVRTLSTATRSAAPAYRGALMSSMHDRRAGADGDDRDMD